MASLKRIQFSIDIEAPVATVFALMTGPASYRVWTVPFTEGSYYQGTWAQGQKLRFLGPGGDGGMVSEIAEHRDNAFTSIRHLGFVVNGVDDTQSEAIKAWAPAYENYSFVATPTGTRVVMDQDVTADFEDYVMAAWPKALQALKQLCEDPAASARALDLNTLHVLNKKFIHNFVTNDVASHERIIHPAFRTVTSGGGHMGRADYLQEWATGFSPDVIPYWDMRDERITLLGDVALVTASTKYTRVKDGQSVDGMTCYTDTYLRTTDGWRCVLAQLTPVAPANYPADHTIVVKYIRGTLT